MLIIVFDFITIKAENAGFYPTQFNKLKGRRM